VEQQKQAKIIDRLKKMLTHEASARELGSIGEAENFAAKIQEFLVKYNLSRTDVEIQEEQTTLGSHYTGCITFRLKWQRILCHSIGVANGVHMVVFSDGYTGVLVGESADVDVVMELFKYFAQLGMHL
jgi:hypothetical protein